MVDETYHARLFVERDGKIGEIDARPSDALALAVRVGAPIFAVPSVLDLAGLGADGGLGVDEDGEPIESLGEGVVDPRLDVFRDFVNSLDVDQEQEGRGS
jgi:bifunctional DNase/RNase